TLTSVTVIVSPLIARSLIAEPAAAGALGLGDWSGAVVACPGPSLGTVTVTVALPAGGASGRRGGADPSADHETGQAYHLAAPVPRRRRASSSGGWSGRRWHA